jgi:hypothetical protein
MTTTHLNLTPMTDSRDKPIASFIVSGADPLTSMTVSGETVTRAAEDPVAIGRLMVDMAIAEGDHDLDGYSLTYERNDAPVRRLTRFESGMEDLLTGGWVRVLNAPNQDQREEQVIAALVANHKLADHGIYRGVRLLQFT